MKGMFGVFIGLVFSATAVAQQGTAELRGKVMDQQSAVLPGVADRPYKGAVPDITLCLIGPWALATAASPHTGIRARTEIIASAHQGQKEAWQQAVDEGLLDSSETNREWITTDDDRLCPICEPMNGQIVGLGEAFLDGDGEDVEEPPVHPNCRCTVGISFEAKTEQPKIEPKEIAQQEEQ